MTAQKALEIFRTGIDGVILDVGLPDASGFDVCRTMRQERDLPILFLSARSGEIDRIVGLEIGADDYVVKPFSPREVTARLRAVLRRYRPEIRDGMQGAPQVNTVIENDSAKNTFKTASGLQDLPSQFRMQWNGIPLDLSAQEYRILALLNAHPGRVYTRQQLMEAVWESPGSATERAVDAHIKSIRAKLRLVAADSEIIVTHRGFGYSSKP
jgi:two-component system catabolic regulation response regulator CreB